MIKKTRHNKYAKFLKCWGDPGEDFEGTASVYEVESCK